MARKDGIDIASMEMLTDSICDIFGLFCFLLILFTILPTMEGGGEPTAVVAPDRRSNEALEEEVARLEDQLAMNSDPVRDEKLAQLQSASETLERAKRRQAEADRRTTAVVEELRVDPDQMEPLKSMIPSLDADVRRLKEEIADAIARSEISMALPRITSTNANSSFIMIITGRKLYVVHGKDFVDESLDLCTRFNSFEPTCVDGSKTTVECGSDKLTQRIVLRLGDGIDLRDAMWSESPRWLELWKWIGIAPVAASMIVDPDSFREFATVRRFLTAQGMKYDVHPEVYGDHYLAVWYSGRPSGQ